MMIVWAALLALHLGFLGWLAASGRGTRGGRDGRGVRGRRSSQGGRRSRDGGGGLSARDSFIRTRAPELLLVLTLVPALFSFIYASNANMDYVQRFFASKGNVRLAPNSFRERLDVGLRYGPLVAIDIGWLVLSRLLAARRHAEKSAAALVRDWALPLSFLSSVLYALSFPSFVSTPGFPALAWISLVPLFVVLEVAPPGWDVFYGTTTGVLGSMLVNFWLGTFSLVSLQFETVVAALQYVAFMAIALMIARRAGEARFLVMPMAWTVFDWLRSLGFLGYPWGILGTTQYASTRIIQVASLGGVWMVSFLVLLTNGVAAWVVAGAVRGARRTVASTVFLFACFLATFAWSEWRLFEAGRADSAARTVRVALVQQDTDPRKTDYNETFGVLKSLTTQALPASPDLVAWSETAFVPNIRRWSALPAETNSYTALTHQFLQWQKEIGRWLLTGNDDYELVAGTEERLDYNAAVLFSPAGERVETYHKIHLVPFTEYFPWKKQLPGAARLLENFDVYLWEPGRTRVVFRHPLFTFSTPICFEDSFPNDVRLFVRAGADVILNISNDYWSLTEAEAMQHAANAVFRSVENDRPLLRASASGLTCFVDRVGRIVARAPFYEPAFLVVDVPIAPGKPTLYTRWGDWFPGLLAALLALELGFALPKRRAPR